MTFDVSSFGVRVLDFHLPGLGFFILFMLKMSLEPHSNDHLPTNERSRHISSHR
jgi:hypothetical protein